ncbi:PBP1A family penicillin-binding protein [Agathobacter sp. LCP21S3_B2]|uniref:PBP1A family penicillin-binding protein n=1 Tax=Agathobacter sp. LCP21S3_B2 TaxID=3438734 RepID=UPI003F91976B
MAKQKKKKKKKQHRVFWFFIKLQIFLMVLILGGLCFYYFGGYADKVAKLHSEAVELVQKSDKNTFLPARTSTLYDTNGDEISETATTKKADYVKYADIPQNFVNCMVSIEDKKFYKHNGVDLKAIVRAAKSIIKNKRITQGGSTITMQLARNIYLDTNKNWQRKVKEMFIAMELEKKYSKNDIMEFYLNNVNFMNGYYGIQAACHGYFNCELSDLDMSQTAFLCAIPNRPTYYDPINNKDHTLTRRNLILKNLREDGKITQQEYESAINEEITLNMPEKEDTVKYNYVDTYAYYCATRALMENEGFKFKYYFDSDEEEKEYDASYDEMYSYCQKKLYSEGYKIYTSIDLTKQQQLQDSIDLTLLDFTDTTDDGTFKLQSAATCIDNATGYVVAIVGGRSQDATNHTLNRAFQSHRQPGSSIKPLIVYTPSFERGKTPDTIVNDHKFDGGPSNAGDSYYGDVTIRFAVEKSLNTVAWQLYDELTPKVGLQYLKDMNFTNIVKDDYVTATALGGFTTGVSPLEMASAYATLENDGMYRNPTCVTSIVDSDNNIIYTSSQKDAVIYSENAARTMTDVMTGVMTEGTGRKAKLDNGMPSAGKTGTTNGKKDGWFCGFTRYYTTCVWVGCDMPETINGLTGSSYPAEIWKTYMDQIHSDLTPLNFLPYEHMSDESQDNQESQEVQDTPADDQTQNNPTDQTVTTPDAGTTTDQTQNNPTDQTVTTPDAGTTTDQTQNNPTDQTVPTPDAENKTPNQTPVGDPNKDQNDNTNGGNQNGSNGNQTGGGADSGNTNGGAAQ